MKLFHFEIQLRGEWSVMEEVMPGSYGKDFNFLECLMDQYIII